MSLPGPAKAATGATPVSINATSTPRPVKPAFHQASAPVSAVTAFIEYGSVAGSYPAAEAGASRTKGTTAAHASKAAPRRRRSDTREKTGVLQVAPSSNSTCGRFICYSSSQRCNPENGSLPTTSTTTPARPMGPEAQ